MNGQLHKYKLMTCLSLSIQQHNNDGLFCLRVSIYLNNDLYSSLSETQTDLFVQNNDRETFFILKTSSSTAG